MLRYIATAALAVLLFGAAVALRPRAQSEVDRAPAAVLEGVPDVTFTCRPDGGRLVRVHLRCAGTLSRARLVYSKAGESHVAAQTSDCRQALESGGTVRGDGYRCEVELKGVVPAGATYLRLIAESETGTRVAPIEIAP